MRHPTNPPQPGAPLAARRFPQMKARRTLGLGTTLAAIALVATTLGACATLGRNVFQTPTVSFRDVRIQGIGLTGGQLEVQLNVFNPNGYTLSATGLNYRLLVDSVALGSGTIDQRFSVGGGDSTVVRIPVSFNYSGLGSAGRALLQRGTLNYRILGDVTVATPLGNFTRPFDRTGQFASLSGSR